MTDAVTLCRCKLHRSCRQCSALMHAGCSKTWALRVPWVVTSTSRAQRRCHAIADRLSLVMRGACCGCDLQATRALRIPSEACGSGPTRTMHYAAFPGFKVRRWHAAGLRVFAASYPGALCCTQWALRGGRVRRVFLAKTNWHGVLCGV